MFQCKVCRCYVLKEDHASIKRCIRYLFFCSFQASRLTPELAPDVEQHNTSNEAKGTNQNSGRSDLDSRRIIGVKTENAS